MNFAGYSKEIEKKLNQAARGIPQKKSRFLRRYMNSIHPLKSNLRGLTVPKQRIISKAGFSFSSLTPLQQLKIWDYVWKKYKSFESRSQALLACERLFENVDIKVFWRLAKKWAPSLDNWAHSDSLSSFYSRVLEKNPKLIQPTLSTWNHSGNSWLRRQSIVSLFYYSRARIKQPALRYALRQMSNLLEDSDFYVQRGIGWALRECNDVYPVKTGAFLQKNICKLSPIAFSVASEKIGKNKKKELRLKRKRFRKNK